jgi:hypothetical protein
MTRNDADLLRANILFHLAVGCERVLVVDNGSSDATRRTLRWLGRCYPIDWTTRPEGLPRAQVVTELADDARRAGADWVLPLDTDEFWHATGQLPELLADAGPIGALEVPRIEFVQARDQIHSRTTAIVRADHRVEPVVRGGAAIEQFLALERSAFELAPPSKLLLRVGPELEIELGAHSARGLVGPVDTTTDVAIFHLQLRSRDEAFTRAEDDRRLRLVDSREAVAYETAYWSEIERRGLREEAWRAHSHQNGTLDVFGRTVELEYDPRLARVLAPYARGVLRQRLGDLRHRLISRPRTTPGR